MKSFVTLVVLASLWGEVGARIASARGAEAFEKKEYSKAAEHFRRAQELAPSPRNAFNLGTAQVAAGQREQGSATLAAAVKDPALRADALFNRGNSALAAKALDHAVRDYADALRADPRHAAAKRNLEIALQRREQQRRSSADRANQQGQSQQQQQQQAPAQGQQQPKGDIDLEALLRSVQQQEQDELRRMKGKAGEARVGW